MPRNHNDDQHDMITITKGAVVAHIAQWKLTGLIVLESCSIRGKLYLTLET